MIKRIGTVVSVLSTRARVQFAPVPAATRAEAAPSSCCTPAAVPESDRAVEAASAITLHRGDRVEVLVPEPRSLAARLEPLFPALALPVAGAVVGGILYGDAGAGIGIGAGLVLGVVAAVLVSRRRSGSPDDKARVLRIVGPAVPVGHCASAGGSEQRR